MKYCHYLLLLLLISLLVSLRAEAQECKRIVSLAPSVTNNLSLLGVADRIVGRTQFCFLTGDGDVPVVADAINVNIEKVVSLRPDIVIASGLTHPRIITALKKMGIRTVHWRQPKSFEEICSQLEDLGKVCGKSDVAARYVRESRERLAGIGKPAQGRKVFFEQGANPLFTALPDSFVNDYILLLGGKNICDDLKSGIISRELVLLRNPDIIIIVTMGDTDKTETAEWKKYPTVNAVRTNRIYTIGDAAFTPTPVTFVDQLELLANQIKL